MAMGTGFFTTMWGSEVTITVKQINAAIAKAEIPLEIVRGSGYQYFVLDDGKRFETESVMVCYLNQLTVAQWVDEARVAMSKMEQRLSSSTVSTYR
jgi:hypothetical protein